MADYKRLQDEASNQKVNPNAWWDGKNGAEKALGIIGIILGGFGGAGNNTALKIMNDQVNRDIDAQKTNMAGKQKRADAAMNIYSQKMRQFGDEGAAELATRGQMIEQYKLQMQSEAEKSGSKMAMANAQQAIGQLSLEQAKIHASLEHWQQGGPAGGVTKEDAARAAIFAEKGVPPEKALQMAMAMRGAAPTAGLPTIAGKGGKLSPEQAAASAMKSGEAPQSLSLGERAQNWAAGLPGVGPAFQDTTGARKGLALETQNFPVRAYAHKVGGARTPENQEHMAGSLMYKTSDTPERIAQKKRLREMVAQGVLDSGTAEGLADRMSAGDEE